MSSEPLRVLAKRPDDEVYWVNEHSKSITHLDIEQFKYQNFELLSDQVGKKVAFLFDSRSVVARLLFCLDGISSRLFIVPSDVKENELTQLLKQADIDFLFSDKNYEITDIASSDVKLANGKNDTAIDNQTLAQTSTSISSEWIIATSGTTGMPKLLVHTLSELTGSVKRNASRGKEFVWGLLYDLSKYAGLQVYLQSLIGGSSLLIPNAADSLDQQIAYLAKHQCNALSATPTLWRKILMSPQSKNLKLVQITLGGEIVDQSILDALSREFADAKIIHIYASTEAGVGFSVSDKLAGFPEDYLSSSPADVSLKISEERLFIKSAKTAQKSLNSDALKDDDGFVDTNDLVAHDNGRYYFIGRASGLINVGGNKVYPEEVEQVLLSHEQVKLAYVYGKSNPIMGNLVVCDIVVENPNNTDAKVLTKEIRHFCAQRLPDWKVPAMFKIVDTIETALSGKQVRK